MLTYGGDEVNAVVLDMGTYNTRAGFSGEYTPKCVIRTAVGHRRDVDSQQQQQPADNANDTSDGIEGDASTKPPPEASSPASASASASASKSKYIAGALDRLFWHNQMDIRNPLNSSDGLVNDWELLECVWDYIYHGSLRCNPSDHPLIATDPVWATSKQREKMAELAFEKFGAPAFYLARDAVMAAFAAGRPSGLVVSCGGNLTSVVPVLEGIVIKKPIQLQSFAGEHLSENILTILERDIGLEGGQPRHQVGNAGVVGDIVVPPYLVSRKTLVGAGERANFSLRTGFGSESGLTASFLKAQKLKVVHEFKENVCQISERPYDAQFLASRPKRPFEFPTGYNLQFGSDRFQLAEMLFAPPPPPSQQQPQQQQQQEQQQEQQQQQQQQQQPTALKGLAAMVVESVSKCDADVRPQFCSNILLTGGSTLIPGFTERLQAEVTTALPGLRVKVQASGNTAERQFGSWIGASMVSSLGTFHQLWVSKQEYEEQGSSIIAKKLN